MARLAALLLLVALTGCATPVAPTGGPADTTPPTLVRADPADGATNVTDRTLKLTFSERLDPAAAQAVTVTPGGDVAPEVRVRARELEVTLPELRDSTTYVVTVGTELRDQRRVALRAPITVAFATGPTIDRGRLDGVVRGPEAGAGVGGLAVWAYALADTTALPDVAITPPDYRTQTGDDGTFRLDYLRPGRYFVVAVADRNRNGRADAGEAFASPPRPALTASDDSAASAPPARFWTTALDTIPPEARRVQTLSDRRFGVRFSEAVRLGAAGADVFTVADSVSGRPVEAVAYQPPGDAFVVFVQTASTLPPTRHVVTYAGGDAIADSSGLAPPPFSLGFTPPERADTTQARFVGFVPEADSVAVLARGQRPGVRFAAPADVASRVSASGLDSLRFETDDGVTFRLPLDGLAAAFSLSVREGDSTYTQRYAVLGEDETGAIVGRAEADSGAVIVEVRPEAGGEPVTASTDAEGRFTVGGLAPGAYRVRLVGDRNGNGRWDGGRLVPYAPPEPLVILDGTTAVRARWETEIEPVDLRAP